MKSQEMTNSNNYASKSSKDLFSKAKEIASQIGNKSSVEISQTTIKEDNSKIGLFGTFLGLPEIQIGINRGKNKKITKNTTIKIARG